MIYKNSRLNIVISRALCSFQVRGGSDLKIHYIALTCALIMLDYSIFIEEKSDF
jgi:hypothetical protein